TIETLQAAAQSAHDAALEMSHTMLRLLGTQADSSAKGPQSFQIQETYKTALGRMRDFGEAALPAQSRALQACREHVLKAFALTTRARGIEREPYHAWTLRRLRECPDCADITDLSRTVHRRRHPGLGRDFRAIVSASQSGLALKRRANAAGREP